MTFDQLDEIGTLLYGGHWQARLADDLSIKRQTIQQWKKQGVAKWVHKELRNVILQRELDVLKASEIFNSLENQN